MWNASEAVYSSFENGDYVRVEGTTQLFQGAATDRHPPDARSIRARSTTTISPPCAPVDVDKLDAAAGEILRTLTDPHLRNLAECFLMDEALWRSSPGPGRDQEPPRLPGRPAGARGEPDGGGAADRPCYPQIDRDLLLIGAFLHDIGKIDELSYERDLAYSDEGQLIGHLVMAVGMLEEKIAEAEKLSGEPLPAGNRVAAEAHDRQPSRRVRVRQPQAADDLEAVALYCLDNLDAKVNSFQQLLRDDPNVDSPGRPSIPT